MKRLIVLALIGLAAWQAYGQYQKRRLPPDLPQAVVDVPPPRSSPRAPASGASYRCDGRTYCSQMTSCEEATWFLRNCPGTRMDGNHDGVPCEKQWCR